jgi:hypothetical protein
MVRSTTRKANPASKAEPETSVVRTSKTIPTLEPRPIVIMEEPPLVNPSLPCTGRCGHCNLDPCQLHAPI